MKATLIASIAAGALYCAAVFDASGAAQASLDLGRTAQTLNVGPARRALLDRAALLLKNAPSRPLAWHTGAMEAASWINALDAEGAQGEARARAMARSRTAAERSVAIAPVQPLAWTRLAVLGLNGEASPLCAPLDCVATSLRVAPMLEPVTACERLQAGRRAGLGEAALARAVQSYLAARPEPIDAAECLSFLTADARFAALLDLRIQRADDGRRRER